MKIIGITGTIGAGKGTIVDYLVKNYGFKHYSVRDYLIREAQKQNLPLNRDTYVKIANELRHLHSPSFIIDELYKEAAENGVNAIIESIRTPGEIASLRTKDNFSLWAVDADPKIRYERIVARQSETDQISFDTFLANEQREMNADDPTKQNLAECIRQADVRFENNGDLKKLYGQIEFFCTQMTRINADFN
jgi:dephospho-CoA kinase